MSFEIKSGKSQESPRVCSGILGLPTLVDESFVKGLLVLSVGSSVVGETVRKTSRSARKQNQVGVASNGMESTHSAHAQNDCTVIFMSKTIFPMPY